MAVRILIIEDESIVATLMKRVLQGLGYEILGTVSTGAQAIEKAGDLRPDIILMDIVIKGDMDGIETAGHIYSKYNIPVIFLTAYADKETFERAKLTEPFGYVIKPFDARELNVTIEIAIYRHKIETELKECKYKLEKLLEERTAQLEKVKEH